jgi:hypothetical protein
MSDKIRTLPDLPLEDWERTKFTLHLYMQIVGKIRLAVMPRKNHWWYLTLYLSPKGFTTQAMPYDDGFQTFEITFNLIDHQLEVVTSMGEKGTLALVDGLSVAEFHDRLFAMLHELGIEVSILDRPFDVPGVEGRFAEITAFASYQPEYAERFWRVMMWVDGVFKEFSGRSYSKTSPPHLYWHHLDLAVTRFSGRKGPDPAPEMRISDKDAYSHEVISFGFWVGDQDVRAPAFYSYAFPSPEGLNEEPLRPESAIWVDNNGSSMALLMYDDLRRQDNPRQALLDFLESAYQAGAKRANWDVEALTVPALADM